MKIKQTITETQAGSRVHLCAGDRGDFFAILSYSTDDHRISGYVGTSASGAIPVVRPVSLRLNGAEVTDARIGAASKWLLWQVSGLRINNPDQEVRGMAAQADAWSSFLGASAPAAKPRKGSPKTATPELVLPSGDISEMRSMGLLTTSAGELVARRVAGYNCGSPISGFTALTVHKSAAKIFDEVEPPQAIDLDRAKAALAAVARPTSHAVTWYGVRDEDLGRLRAQAAASYPVLAGMIAETPSIARRVDEMSSIAEALGERTGLSKAALKRIGKLRAPLPDGPLFEPGEAVRGEDALGVNRLRRTMVRGAVTLDGCLSELAKMPPDRTPQTDADWLSFAATLAGCARPIHNALDIPETRILEASKGNWDSWRGTLARAADFAPEEFSRREITLGTIDALEALDDFNRTVIMPLVLRSIESTGQPVPPQTPEYLMAGFAAAGEIVLGKSKSIAVSLLEMSRRYASRIPALMAIDGIEALDPSDQTDLRWSQYGDDSFPVLTEDFPASNGLVVRPLRNFCAMQEESRRLTHCVGHYYLSSARQADCHLFSVQSIDGSTSHSTVQLSKVPSDGDAQTVAGRLIVTQHRAERNCAPSAEAEAACAEWLATLRRNELPLAIDEIRAWRKHLVETRNGMDTVRTAVYSWKGALGTDWQDLDKAGEHWAEWTGIIASQAVRGETPEALFRHACVRQLVGEMSPAAATILEERAREASEARAAQAADPALPEP